MKSFVKNFRYWNFLALNEIRQKYRRSTLGTLWVSLSTAITILGIGPIYSVLFKTDLSDYFVLVSISLITWNFISSIIGESCGVFVANSAMIKDTSLPVETYCYVVIWRNLLLLFQNLIILYIIFNLFSFSLFPNYRLFIVIAVLGFVLCNLGMLLSIACTRFRDLSQIVDALMKLLFFMTPILWIVKGTKLENSVLVKFNIFYYMVDLLRNAFVSNTMSFKHLGFMVILGIISGIVNFMVFNKYRNRIVYWL